MDGHWLIITVNLELSSGASLPFARLAFLPPDYYTKVRNFSEKTKGMKDFFESFS